MEIDLDQEDGELGELGEKLRSQVCVVGGGIAGLILAERLEQYGIRVTLLEAGGRGAADGEDDDPFAAESAGAPHAGTRVGRVRALGGCSTTWGGQLLSLPDDASWPVPLEEIRAFERNWELPYEAEAFLAAQGAKWPRLLREMAGLTPRLSRFVPFSQRNLGRRLGKKLRASARVTVVLHAPVVELVLSPERDRVVAVEVRTRTGGALRIAADEFVVAAGTVETCRLLLASRAVAPEGVGNASGQVGLHFHDHLTMSAAELTGVARARMLGALRPWVFGPPSGRRAVYSMKLEASRGLREELGLNPVMAHLTIEEPEGAGVGAVRSLLRARQVAGRGVGVRALPGALVSGVRLAWEAGVRHRRYVSPEARVFLQVNVAQDASSGSRVLLSEAKDSLGMPKAVVDWRVSEGEIATVKRFARWLREWMAGRGIDAGVVWVPALFEDGEAGDEVLRRGIDDARHAMGGAVMGTDPGSSVVDAELRVHGVANLSLASAAVFPDGSAQFPTVTLSALCLRLADRLQRRLSAGR